MLKSYRVELNVDFATTNEFCDQAITGACFVVGVGAHDEDQAASVAIEYLRTRYYDLNVEVSCVEDGAFTLEQCNVIAGSENALGKVRLERLANMLEIEVKPHVETSRTMLDDLPSDIDNVKVVITRLTHIINCINAELYGGMDNPNTEEYE